MLSQVTKFLLAATSIAPIFVTFALVAFWQHHWRQGIILGVVVLVLVFLCRGILRRAASVLPVEELTFTAVKPADREITGFVIAYLLPLAKANGTSFDLPLLVIFLVIFFLVVLTSNSYHMNPLVGALGYHFYEVTVDGVTYVLISRRTLHHIRGKHRTVTLADYMLLDSPEKKP
jgi:MFS family permease